MGFSGPYGSEIRAVSDGATQLQDSAITSSHNGFKSGGVVVAGELLGHGFSSQDTTGRG